jgi:hypothetical protein
MVHLGNVMKHEVGLTFLCGDSGPECVCTQGKVGIGVIAGFVMFTPVSKVLLSAACGRNQNTRAKNAKKP